MKSRPSSSCTSAAWAPRTAKGCDTRRAINQQSRLMSLLIPANPRMPAHGVLMISTVGFEAWRYDMKSFPDLPPAKVGSDDNVEVRAALVAATHQQRTGASGSAAKLRHIIISA